MSLPMFITDQIQSDNKLIHDSFIPVLDLPYTVVDLDVCIGCNRRAQLRMVYSFALHSAVG